MAILNNPLHDADHFVEGLLQASRGVVRVHARSKADSTPAEMRSSGWMITDTLVVMPAYAAFVSATSSHQKFYCYFSFEKQRPIKADLLDDLTDSRNESRPVILRLREALKKCALSLEVKTMEPGESVIIPQYAGGLPRLQFSLGLLNFVDRSRLQYDASTSNGSSGSPVINLKTWKVIGMHTARSESFNEGISLPALLDSLRQTSVWSEIASFHNLVDAATVREAATVASESAPPAPAERLLAAAVRWHFDPLTFAPEDREILREISIDAPPGEGNFEQDDPPQFWTLQTNERQRLLRTAGSLEALRAARGDETTDDPGQKVIDQILQGPPYRLDEMTEDELPYWLQAVRWFDGVTPSLPTPAAVNRMLERRRVRSRLLTIAGPGFRGRTSELKQMNDWYQKNEPGPLVISGIGGIGKSSLVAQFALNMTGDAPLLWLDFDRADLAPDDAESVLKLLSEQCTMLLDGFIAPQISADDWEESADGLGAELAARTVLLSPLLVLDGFEVAQHVKQHHKIWEVLERILDRAPELRVIVSGRAPVDSLKLRGRDAVPLHLKGMARADAEMWLREHGVTDAEVLERVLKISDGVPLLLKLAVRWVESGGQISDLPDELPKTLVDGFLYSRILDRVIDPLLKPVAHDALVLRSLTEELIAEVLIDAIPKGLTAADVFSRLRRELGLVTNDEDARQSSAVILVENAGVLRLRPEVRSATLKLLELNDLLRVRTIDERAAAWYTKQNSTETADLAELVYHLLRLGDIEGAEKVWVDDCAALLLFAHEDLPESAQREREWLLERTREVDKQPTKLALWEREALKRINSVISRGHLRAVTEVLSERPERSKASPLFIYDAWTRWSAGDLKGARDVIHRAGEAEGAIGRDRAVMGALLAAQDKDLPEADRLLAKLDGEDHWADRPDGETEAMAIRAARIRLTVDIQKEFRLSQIVQGMPPEAWLKSDINNYLRDSDVLLPNLSRWLGDHWKLEAASSSFSVPHTYTELKSFAHRFYKEKGGAWIDPQRLGLPSVDDTSEVPPDSPWRASELKADHDEIHLSRDLSVLSWRRWHLVTSSDFLAQGCEQALNYRQPSYTLSLSIAGTLAAFHSQQMQYLGSNELFLNLDILLLRLMSMTQQTAIPAPPVDRVKLTEAVLQFEIENESSMRKYSPLLRVRDPLNRLIEALKNPTTTGNTFIRDICPDDIIDPLSASGLHSIILYLLGPDPLEVLCRRLIGIPNNLKQ